MTRERVYSGCCGSEDYGMGRGGARRVLEGREYLDGGEVVLLVATA